MLHYYITQNLGYLCCDEVPAQICQLRVAAFRTVIEGNICNHEPSPPEVEVGSALNPEDIDPRAS